jgi:hypothetical protein
MLTDVHAFPQIRDDFDSRFFLLSLLSKDEVHQLLDPTNGAAEYYWKSKHFKKLALCYE